MKKGDFLKIIGASEGGEYVPVAGMLKSGHGFAGYFNTRLNEDLEDTCVLLNIRIIWFQEGDDSRTTPRINNFNEFVEEIVIQSYQDSGEPQEARSDIYGKSVPLSALPYGEILIVYPVGQIGKMMQRLSREQKALPSFLDFDNRSLLLRILRTKLW